MTQHGLKEYALSSAASRKRPFYGTAIGTSDLALQPRIHAILRDCNLVTSEYEIKWDAICRDPQQPDYEASDKLVAFASSNGVAFHGHTLWWHESIPAAHRKTTDNIFTRAALQHLRATVSRYAGQLHSWDVVNEVLEPAHDRTDGLRLTPFLNAMGSVYIGLAYREAAALDPAAVLVLNEMGLEYAHPEAEKKRRLMIALLERELSRGTPIACLGIQSHLTAMEQPHRHPNLRAFLREIARMGLSVMITELDVSDHLCPRDRKERDRMVADTYRAYLDLVLEESTVLAVSTWGLSDDKTWLNGFRPRPDRARQRPLPLDRALRRKPAWHAIKAALLRAGEHHPPTIAD